MSEMVKNVESKEIYLKLLFFGKTIRYYLINPRIFNWRNLPVSRSMSLSMSVSMDTDMDRDMDMDILSAIVSGELKQHESQGLPGWLCLQYVIVCSLSILFYYR
jgi:hypothetical protein